MNNAENDYGSKELPTYAGYYFSGCLEDAPDMSENGLKFFAYYLRTRCDETLIGGDD